MKLKYRGDALDYGLEVSVLCKVLGVLNQALHGLQGSDLEGNMRSESCAAAA